MLSARLLSKWVRGVQRLGVEPAQWGQDSSRGRRVTGGGRGSPALLGCLTLPFPLQGQYCDICTAANSNRAHPASNAIDGTERWWQSPPLSRGLEYNEVNVTLDLGQVGAFFACYGARLCVCGCRAYLGPLDQKARSPP